jgi:cytochrome c peroxidase
MIQITYSKKYIAFLLFVSAICMCSCLSDEKGTKFNYLDFVPSHFPIPDIPQDSFPTELKVAFGRKLFYDPILSRDSTISCASCHNPALAFSDEVALSLGVDKRLGTRNSPSLANVVYQKALLREGGIPTIEQQILVPIQEHNEFDNNMLVIVKKMKNNSKYISLAKSAFNREIDPFVVTRAIAAFERTLISGNAKYDQSINNKIKLSAIESQGKDLFFSEKTNCSSCHSGFLFTNQGFENNGLYSQYIDEGRKRLTGLDSDDARFKVPSLRNIELTAPYMHDGSIATLEGVIDHYSDHVVSHINKSDLVRSLQLTKEEKTAMLAFLKTLTDYEFINDNRFRNE